MADGADDSQKTEAPSQRKLNQAHGKGQVAQSREINNWFGIGAALIVLVFFSGPVAHRIGVALMPYIERPYELSVDGSAWVAIRGTLVEVGGALLVPAVFMVIASIAGALVQTGLIFATDKLVPSLDHLSPIKGFSRIFSLRGIVEFGKNLAKLAVVLAVMAYLLRPELGRLSMLQSLAPMALLDEFRSLVIRLGLGVFSVLTLIAMLDYGYQRFSFLKSMRMSKQEVKEEHKQQEGDPMVRARLRQIRMDRARKRMMAAVPGASVVVTNPTHYAVALKYEMGVKGAPLVVAKGADLVALRIREVAKENNVPIVENPPLARALYGGVKVDQEIPPEHYKAVAEIIGYVFRLQGKLRRS